MDHQKELVLGIFCPFWSDEGPHFILPHFIGSMRWFKNPYSFIDLNIEVRNFDKKRWLEFVSNQDGLWFQPDATHSFLESSGIFDKLHERIKSCQPEWIVFLSVSVSSYYSARVLMKLIRERINSNYRIAVGGPICQNLATANTIFPEADLTWSGPLEKFFPYLNGNSNLSLKTNDFIRFKPDFAGIDFNSYSSPERLPYVVNYGCRFHCLFCHEGAQYKREIQRSVVNLGEEIKTIVKSNPTVKYVRFNDGSLNSDFDQFVKILREMKKSCTGWVCNISPMQHIDTKFRTPDLGKFVDY